MTIISVKEAVYMIDKYAGFFYRVLRGSLPSKEDHGQIEGLELDFGSMSRFELIDSLMGGLSSLDYSVEKYSLDFYETYLPLTKLLANMHKKILLCEHQSHVVYERHDAHKMLRDYTAIILRPFLDDLVRSENPDIMKISSELTVLSLSPASALSDDQKNLATTSILAAFLKMNDEQKTKVLPSLIKHHHISSRPIDMRSLDDMLVAEERGHLVFKLPKNRGFRDHSRLISALSIAVAMKDISAPIDTDIVQLNKFFEQYYLCDSLKEAVDCKELHNACETAKESMLMLIENSSESKNLFKDPINGSKIGITEGIRAMQTLSHAFKDGFFDDERFDRLRARLIRDTMACCATKRMEFFCIEDHKAFAHTLLTPFRPEIIKSLTKNQQMNLFHFLDNEVSKKNVGLMGKIKAEKFEHDLGI